MLNASTLLALALPPPAPTVTVVNLGTGNVYTTAGLVSISVGSAVAVGTLVVISIFDGYGIVTGTRVIDSKGNIYIPIAAHAQPTSPGPANVQFFYSFITTALTTSDTITYYCAVGFSGYTTLYESAVCVNGYGSVDPAITNVSDGYFTTPYSVSGAGNAAVADEINFGLIMCNTTIATGPGAGWVLTNTPSANQFVTAYQVNIGTSPLTFSGTLTTSQVWAASIISFKPGVPVVGPKSNVVTLMMGL